MSGIKLYRWVDLIGQRFPPQIDLYVSCLYSFWIIHARTFISYDGKQELSSDEWKDSYQGSRFHAFFAKYDVVNVTKCRISSASQFSFKSVRYSVVHFNHEISFHNFTLLGKLQIFWL